MLKFIIEVGIDEKHIVDFTVNQFWGYVDIKIDGQQYKQRKLRGVLVKQNWTFEFTVGNEETHVIRIELVKSLFSVSMSDCSAWVYIDGEKIQEYSGKLSIKDKLFGGINYWNKMIIIITTLLVMTIITFLIIFHLPVSIDKEFNGILFRGGSSEPEYSQPINIKIEGEYYRKLFQTYWFEGSIDVSDFQHNNDLDVLQDKPKFSFNIGNPVIEAYWDISKSPFGHSIDGGFLYMKPDTNEIMIIVFERDENGQDGHAAGQDGLYYAAPCNTREEALEIVNDIFPMFWGRLLKPIEKLKYIFERNLKPIE